MERVMWGPEIDVEAIVDAVGGLPEGKSAKKLLLDLRVAGDKFFGAQIYERSRRGDKQASGLLPRIEKNCRMLARLLGELSGESLESDASGDLVPPPAERRLFPMSLFIQATLGAAEGPGGSKEAVLGGHRALVNALDGVLLLQRWSAAASRYPPDRTQSDYEEMGLFRLKDGETPESWLIGKYLPELYADHFEKPFGISKPPAEGEPFGPGIRFVQACLTQWGFAKSSWAIEQVYDRYRKRHGT